jgi:hypothetical protein
MPEISPGAVVEFAYLHMDSAQYSRPHEHKERTGIYQIEGKNRPMVVFALRAAAERGHRWYLVAQVTSKGRAEDGTVKPGYEYVGKCITDDTESFVRLALECYPDNLIHSREGRPVTYQPCNTLAFHNAMRVLTFRIFRGGANAVFHV